MLVDTVEEGHLVVEEYLLVGTVEEEYSVVALVDTVEQEYSVVAVVEEYSLVDTVEEEYLVAEEYLLVAVGEYSLVDTVEEYSLVGDVALEDFAVADAPDISRSCSSPAFFHCKLSNFAYLRELTKCWGAI